MKNPVENSENFKNSKNIELAYFLPDLEIDKLKIMLSRDVL